MDSGRKKRKMGNEEENDDDNNEEEKIEKFFALIRSAREMRDHLRNRPNGSKEEEENKEEKKKVDAAAPAVWNPTFQPEDFIEDSKFKKHSVAYDSAGPSSKKQQEQEKEAKQGEEDTSLDLKLSL